MNAPGTIDFAGFKSAPVSDNKSVLKQVVANSPWEVQLTGNYHLIALMSEAMNSLEHGDIVAVFTDNNEFAGQVLVEKYGENAVIVAFGDDATTETSEGLLSGENMNFRLYRHSTGELINLEVEFDNRLPNTNLFAENGASMISKLTYEATSSQELANVESLRVFPNPSNGLFKIIAGGFTGRTEIQVLNTQGQLIYDETFTNDRNDIQISLDLSAFPKGFYFVKTLGEHANLIAKIIIN